MAYNFLRESKVYQQLLNSGPTSSPSYFNKLLSHLPPSISEPISKFLETTSTPVLVLLGVISFISAFLAYAAYKIWIYPFYLSPLRNVPGPPRGHWLYGQMPAIIKSEAGVIQGECGGRLQAERGLGACSLRQVKISLFASL